VLLVNRSRLLTALDPRESRFVGGLLRQEAVGGALALLAAAVALVWANLSGSSYDDLRQLRVGPLDLEHWAADGALTVFFLVAGLELKRELVVGSLRRPADALVPVLAAVSGVAVPAAVFVAVQLLSGSSGALVGWAVPTATDIAFALAVLAVVGPALPTQLRAFLLTLAVVDDVIVIAVIAVGYTDDLDLVPLGVAALALAGYAAVQRLRVRSAPLPLVLAVVAWWSVHESGVHATVAGVALGLLTRVRPDEREAASPAERLEHRLAPLSAGVAVPFFAFMSAGVVLAGGAGMLADPVVLGVALGLVLGKPAGVLGGAWAVTRFTGARLDDAVGWRDLAGVSVLCGMGFTVSLLVSDLAFTGARRDEAKAAVLLASLVAALLAAAVLGRRNRRHRGIAAAR
jgi:NhaA family Na+:H+ antiporter